jgi:DNA-binding transcriptional MerR regulator
MAYTVKKLAKLSGVSIRTLHFYDEIGLLKPAYYGDNKYRYYEVEQLLLLQQILFFRELNVPLNEIQRIICSNDFDQIQALTSHRQVLQQGLDRAEQLIKTIDKTIAHLRGKSKMNDEEIYCGFDSIKQKEMEEFLIQGMGKPAEDLIAESNEKIKHLKKEDFAKMKQETDELCKEFASAIENERSPSSAEVQKLVNKHYEKFKRFYTPTKDIFIKVNTMETEHPEYKKYYAMIHPKFAEFFLEAINIFAERNL